jgi:hypothetical protein
MEKVLEKLHNLMKVKNNLTLMAKESGEVLQISAKELVRLIQSNKNSESLKESGRATISSNSINLAQTKEGISNRAPLVNETYGSNWILDSGASAHVTGSRSEFASYAAHPPIHKETIQIADGTYQPVKGVDTGRHSEMHSVHYIVFSLVCSIVSG